VRITFIIGITGLLPALGGCHSRPAPQPAPVTFNKDIAPIFFANCATCHRPGQPVPFELLRYADAAKHADAIADETLARHMPPWLPDQGEFPILGVRRIRQEQIDAIQRWAKSGKLEGDPKDLPAAPVFPQGWQYGTPDVVLTMPRPYQLKPSKDDVYRNVVLRTSLAADSYVRAVEFQTNGAPVHHAVIRVDRTPASRRRDGEDGQPGFDGMAWQNIQDPEGHFIGWAPGRGPIVAPDGMPWRLERGADLVIELHMIPSEVSAKVQPSVALYLTSTPPIATPVTVKMGSKRIDIPAGVRDYVVTDAYTLPVAVDLMSEYPHAHYLGKDMLVTAKLPTGVTKTLLHIGEWSFHWQQDYRYAAPVPLPAGTTLTMRYTYDNSDDNTENPHHPPVRVQVGPRSVDEMANLGLQVMPKSRADAVTLIEAFEQRDKLENVAIGEARVRENPGAAADEAFLGGSYVEVARFADALPHLELALRLDPKSASAHNYTGGALFGLGRVSESIPHFQKAAALSPRDERIQFNLGNALSALGRPGAAAAAFEAALAINPDFSEAHGNLGALFFASGRRAEALTHLRRAVDLKPDSAVAHSDLGGALAAAGQLTEAMAHVRRALELRPGFPPAMENLARLQRLGIR
jgi:tetratricopeptide (TPR) repeat protein